MNLFLRAAEAISPDLAALERRRRQLILRWRWGALVALASLVVCIAGPPALHLPEYVSVIGIGAVAAAMIGGLRPLFLVRARLRGEIYRAAAEAAGLAYAPGARHSREEDRQIELGRLIHFGLCPEYRRRIIRDCWSGVRVGREFLLYNVALESPTAAEPAPRVDRRELQFVEIRFLRPFDGVSACLDRNLTPPAPLANLRELALSATQSEGVDFRVVSSNEIEARFFFDQAVRQGLRRFADTLKGRNLRALLERDRLFLLLEGGSFYEPGSIFSEIEGETHAHAIIEQLMALLSLLDTIADPPLAEPPALPVPANQNHAEGGLRLSE